MSKPVPDWTFEARYPGPVCGVDEAGRGPLAGPVVAAAIILAPDAIPEGLNDSKALSQGTREHLLNRLIDLTKFHKAWIGIGIAEPEEIDRINILGASLIAMRRAILALPHSPTAALIDGNKAPEELPCPSETIVKGDSKSLSIAAASIIAKQTRDALMAEAEQRFPGYGFAQHKGYPTAAHRSAIAQLGPCPIHRRSFSPIRLYDAKTNPAPTKPPQA